MINHERRRQQANHYIADDPWTVTVTQENESFTFSGRIAPAGARAAPLYRLPRGPLMGEQEQVSYTSVLVAPWDTPEIQRDAHVRAEHPSGVVNEYIVVFPRRTPHKWEVILDDRV